MRCDAKVMEVPDLAAVVATVRSDQHLENGTKFLVAHVIHLGGVPDFHLNAPTTMSYPGKTVMYWPPNPMAK
jgi:hypothetical protein